ncbi:photosystem II cytochrome PsbV2 [Egbenema bharatensis]|uniref:photosystem II cytochrome PsbV2 n=1 Tax=Egbenema bharatensis TaxID=3463334 RepID=UPI003A84E895
MLSFGLVTQAAEAGAIEPYVLRYLDAKEPVSVLVNSQGEMQLFSAEDLSAGQQLFSENCLNCHVGGATLPDPSVPLSLEALKGAVPPRDTLEELVAFIRQPMSYDGSKEAYLCRQVPESWLSQPEVENLAAFVLRAAEKAPGWGTRSF